MKKITKKRNGLRTMKKAAAFALCLLMCVSLLAGCGGDAGKDGNTDTSGKDAGTEAGNKDAEPKSPQEQLTDGYYVYSFPVEGMGDFTYYFHFYDEVPGLGNVYYVGYCLNQVNFAGIYEVEEAKYSYACYEKRGAEEVTEGTAPFTIIFYDWNKKEIDRCGFDGDKIYNDMETITATAATPCIYLHDTDGENSRYLEAYENEADQTFASFIGDDPTQTLSLYHNGVYLDLVNSMIEGSWGMEEQEDGSVTYTLTPKSDSDTAAKLNVSADGATATYVPEEGGEVVLYKDQSADTVAEFKGQMEVMEGITGDFILDFYSDNTCKIILDVYGNVFDLDQGTYTMKTDESGAQMTVTFELAGELASYTDEETNVSAIRYLLPGTDLGDLDVVLLRVEE